MERARGETVIAIDLLRCVAAGLVVLHHFGAALPLAPGPQAAAVLDGIRLPATMAAWTWSGWVGVEIFFTLSGLVIAASAVGKRPAPFLRRRAWRLLPAAWLCASATALAMAVARPDLPVALAWVRSVLMLPTTHGVDPSYWTLAVEWAFYALVAATLVGGGEPRRLEAMATALGLASAGFWMATLALPAALGSDPAFQMTLLPHGCFFALGVLLPRARWPLLAVLLAAGAAEIVHHARDVTRALGLDATPLPALLLFAGAVGAMAAADRLQPWLRRHVGERRAARAAAVTYPLYLLHQVAGAALAAALIRAGTPATLAVALAIAAAVAVACAVAWRAEPSIRRLSRRRGPRPDSRPTASLPTG